MARLPDDEIAKLKEQVSLLRLVESQGYAVRKQGKDYALSCPFHEGDDTPSLIISPASNLFNCFGCGAAGSVIDWVMKTQGLSFRFACELLQKDLGLIADSGTKTVKQNTSTKLASPLNADAEDQHLLRQVVDYYHETLKQSPEALDYLAARGLNDPELINTFKLGFSNRTLGYRLPEKNRKAGAELRSRLQALGILRESGHEHFNGSLVVPVLNEQGAVAEIYGRKILGNRLRKGTPQHLYLPGPHDGVWNIEALKASDEIILCEALIDAMTFWVHGFRHVTVSYGTSGFTAAHLAAFKHYGVKRVLIAYDRDEAGNTAAEALAKKLTAENIDCFRLLLPKGMDVNEYALQITPARKSLGLVIRKAQWLGNGKAPERLCEVDLHTQTTPTDPAPMVPAPSPFTTPAHPAPAALGHPCPSAAQVAEHEPDAPAATPIPAIPEENSSPLPAASTDIDLKTSEQEITLRLGDDDPRHYRVRGFDQNARHDQLKIQLLVRHDERFHMDKLDLYSSKQRQVFINQAGRELGMHEDVIKADLGTLLLKLEELQVQRQSQQPTPEPAEKTLDSAARRAALALLKDPALLRRILDDFDRAGVVGEHTNKLVGYLACVSRKLSKPLAVMIQSSSAAGKSSLMESILALMPEEERMQYSAMTGQSLFYMGETNLKHKILAIAEEEGVSQASYALKLLQSEGEITIASTGKDDTTGNLVTKEYKVEGPVMLFLTTTAIDLDEELLNRCLVLSVNESREQTQAIHAAQRLKRTLAGLQARLEKDAIIAAHRNAQRLLRPLAVINPYADQLTFLDDKTRTRRDHEKYLTLIDSIALLHQYQREIKTVHHDGHGWSSVAGAGSAGATNGQAIEYVEVSLADIEHANRLANEVLGKTLDELPPQTRKLLTLITDLVQQRCKAQGIAQSHFRFSRRNVRRLCGWSETQVRVHLQRLVSMEYLLIHRGGRGQSFEYELLYSGEGEQGEPFLMGLLEVEHLKAERENIPTTATSRGYPPPFAGPTRPQRGGIADPEKSLQPLNGEAYRKSSRVEAEKVVKDKNAATSHRTDSPATLTERHVEV